MYSIICIKQRRIKIESCGQLFAKLSHMHLSLIDVATMKIGFSFFLHLQCSAATSFTRRIRVSTTRFDLLVCRHGSTTRLLLSPVTAFIVTYLKLVSDLFTSLYKNVQCPVLTLQKLKQHSTRVVQEAKKMFLASNSDLFICTNCRYKVWSCLTSHLHSGHEDDKYDEKSYQHGKYFHHEPPVGCH